MGAHRGLIQFEEPAALGVDWKDGRKVDWNKPADPSLCDFAAAAKASMSEAGAGGGHAGAPGRYNASDTAWGAPGTGADKACLASSARTVIRHMRLGGEYTPRPVWVATSQQNALAIWVRFPAFRGNPRKTPCPTTTNFNGPNMRSDPAMFEPPQQATAMG